LPVYVANDIPFSQQISDTNTTMESLTLESYRLKTDQQTNIKSISHALDDISERLNNLKLRETELIKAKGRDGQSRESVFSDDQIEALSQSVREILTIERNISAQHAIIKTVRYDSWPMRHDAIHEAHRETFQWAFESKVASWLLKGGGIFWISGKPGSGKSTLMKFIADHRNTRRYLEKWAYPQPIVNASHYFWAAGAPMQKSLQGLYRSLLYDIFRRLPSCIPIATPERWATVLYASQERLLDHDEPWNLAELSAALQNLAKSRDLPAKVCICVDGMDEFDGDMLELCEILKAFSRSSHIKLCLSSRPWNVFKDAFGSELSKLIYIHELTHNDIHNFARDELQSHPRWITSTCGTDALEREALIEAVAIRAEGVFLWAFLVTKSLREGLSNDDTISDMQERLDSLPRSLEDLFKHILETVDPIYHPKMAGMLRVTAQAVNPLLLDHYWHYEKGFEKLQYAILCPIYPYSHGQILTLREQAGRRINAMTKGLLEVRNGRVEFLHRTVKDYLGTKEGSNYIDERIGPKHSIWLSILGAFLAQMKTTTYATTQLAGIVRHAAGQNTGQCIRDLHEAFLYATLAARAPDDVSQVVKYLDEYERSLQYMQETSQVTVDALTPYDRRLPFREELLKHNLPFYLEKKLEHDPDYFEIFDRSPLFAALMPIVPCPLPERPDPCIRMVEILLQRGIDPNDPMTTGKTFKPLSPLQLFISRELEHTEDYNSLVALLESYSLNRQLETTLKPKKFGEAKRKSEGKSKHRVKRRK
jgi:hypothetical protein